MTITNISVHPVLDKTKLTMTVTDRTIPQTPSMPPYFELHISGVTFYLSPAQLTTIADGLADYSTRLLAEQDQPQQDQHGYDPTHFCYDSPCRHYETYADAA